MNVFAAIYVSRHLKVIISYHALIDQIFKDPSDELLNVDFTNNLSVDGTPNELQKYCPSVE